MAWQSKRKGGGVQRESSPDTGSSSKEWPTSGLIVLFALLPTVILGATVGLVQVPTFPDQSLPLLLIGGITIFLVVICLVVLVFRRLDLHDESKPLGLPEGSIRAFIALSLILLFFMMSVFLYFDLARPARSVATDLTPDQLAAIPGEQIIGSTKKTIDGNVLYDVERRIASGASEDIARQIVTTISTLVVAISAFYFGATVAQSERGRQRKTSGSSNAGVAPATPAAPAPLTPEGLAPPPPPPKQPDIGGGAPSG